MDSLSSFTFESTQPFILYRLQSFLVSILPDSVIRMKGFIHIREFPARRILVSMSGRRRFHLEDEGVWTSTPRTQLVVIGRGGDDANNAFDVPLLTKALEFACDATNVNTPQEESKASILATYMRSLVAKDGRMEIVDPLQLYVGLAGSDQSPVAATAAAPIWVDRLIAFRLTGAPSLGVSSEHLRLQHGVDLDALGLALQQRVNMHGGRSILLHAVSSSSASSKESGASGDCSKAGGLILCFSVDDGKAEEGGAQGLDFFTKVWSFISEEAAVVIRQHMSHLNLCKCGH